LTADQVSLLRRYGLSADGSCSEQNQTSMCCLGLGGAVAEDWVGVRCQSRNNSERASEVTLLRPAGDLQDLAACASC